MDGQSLSRARELFFEFDGSGFYMWHEGVDAEFERLAVPPEVRAAWLRELTAARLAVAAEPGNWRVVHFLDHHGDYAHVQLLVDTPPRGALWEQCAFLEELLRYVGNAAQRGLATAAQVEAAAGAVAAHARGIRRRCRSEGSRRRVDAIVAAASTLGVDAGAHRDSR
jgi:hypothetical protein